MPYFVSGQLDPDIEWPTSELYMNFRIKIHSSEFKWCFHRQHAAPLKHISTTFHVFHVPFADQFFLNKTTIYWSSKKSLHRLYAAVRQAENLSFLGMTWYEYKFFVLLYDEDDWWIISVIFKAYRNCNNATTTRVYYKKRTVGSIDFVCTGCKHFNVSYQLVDYWLGIQNGPTLNVVVNT